MARLRSGTNANNRGPVYQDDEYYHPQPRRQIPRYYDAGYAKTFGYEDDGYYVQRPALPCPRRPHYDDEGTPTASVSASAAEPG